MRYNTRKKAALIFVVLAAALSMGLCAGAASADSDAPGLTPASVSGADMSLGAQDAFDPTLVATSNLWSHDYSMLTSPTKSHLHVWDGALERVEYINRQLIVEEVSSNYKQATSRRVIDESTYRPSNLPEGGSILWGGFFAGATCNYVVTGQVNPQQSDDVAVFRVSQYSKDWSFIAAAELKGANTTIPFHAGSCAMAESAGVLYVRTCHEMYKSDDGLNHQANVHIAINEADMTVRDSYYDIANQVQTGSGYVSHSFNQMLAVASGNVYGFDHGDGGPRAATLKKLYATGWDSYTQVISFPGEVGDNHTGASIGGFGASETTGKLLTAGNWTHDESLGNAARDAWIGIAATDFSTNTYRRITAYDASSSESAGTPFLVKVNDERFLLLWNVSSRQSATESSSSGFNRTGEVRYLFVDGNGDALGEIQSAQAPLSDCQPIVYDGKVVWYAGGGSQPGFYFIDAQSGAFSKVETLQNAVMEHYGQGLSVPYANARTCPATTVKLGGRTLVEGVDYELDYTVDKNALSATITVKGLGDFVGESLTSTFGIFSMNISSLSVNGLASAVYTGQEITPVISLVDVYSDDPITFTQEKGDFEVEFTNNVNAGTASVKITGKGVLSGALEKTFTITPRDIGAAEVSGVSNRVYNGAAQTQSPTVSVDGIELVEGVDYDVFYSDDTTNQGTAYVYLSGKGNYSGYASAAFTIARKSIEQGSITGVCDITYPSYTQQGIGVVVDGKTLAASDYSVSYDNNIGVGAATVTVTGRGNYEGALTAQFQVLPQPLTGATASVVSSSTVYIDGAYKPSFTYSGEPHTPDATVKMGAKSLVQGTDYEIVGYSDNVDAGTATVSLRGKGNYTGELSADFAITTRYLHSTTMGLAVTVPGQTYTGSALTPLPQVMLDEKQLIAGSDFTLSYRNNVNAGAPLASVTLAFTGNYAGTVTKYFDIAKRSLEGASISGITDFVYGQQIIQSPIVTLDGKTLVSNVDYTLSYPTSQDAGPATLTVIGKGNYTGQLAGSFQITPAPLDGATAEVVTSGSVYIDGVYTPANVYTGNPLTPSVRVKVGGKQLVAGTDFDVVSYGNNINVGTATFKAEGRGNYGGEISGTFTISPKTLPNYYTSVIIANQTYSGKALEPAPTVTLDGKELIAGSDYTVSYSNNTNVGQAVLTLAFKGNYTGTTTKRFNIAPRDLSGATVTGVRNLVYGEKVDQNPLVEVEGITLVKGVDYAVSFLNANAVGQATMTISGRGNYVGNLTRAFQIEPVSIQGAEVTGIVSREYTGSAQTQQPSVKLGGITLYNGWEYTLAYADNVEVGTATITITGTGNYAGKVVRTFKILPSLRDATITNIEDRVYDGKAQKQSPVVTYDSKTLRLGTDYTLSYSNNTTDAGSAYVIITGKGKYAGSVTKYFRISPKAIQVEITGIGVKTYTGQPQEQAPIVTYGGKRLKLGEDYLMYCYNNVNTGTASLMLYSKGNYNWSATRTFTIASASIANSKVTGVKAKVYTGKAHTQNLVVTFGSKQLVEGVDYTVRYANNTAFGTGKVIITGLGNFNGSKTVTFSIAPASISKARVSGLKSKAFTGSSITQTPTVTLSGKKLVKGTDYTLRFANNKKVGKARVTVSGKGNYRGSANASFAITKAANPLKVSVKAASLNAAKLKKAAATVTALAVKGAKGKVAFAKASGSARVTVNKSTGKLTIKAGTKKGTYKVKVKVIAAGNASYKKATRTVTVKLVVK